MTSFAYPCPDCGSELAVHELGCSFAGTSRAGIERGYIDIISLLHIAPRRKETLKSQADWSPLHESSLQTLLQRHHVVQKDNGKFRLLTPEEKRRHIHPVSEPLRTIYTYGTVPGCHDNGIFSLVAYYAAQGLSWERTKDVLLAWFDETGTWSRGGFAEPSPEAVLEQKRRVHETGYGWSRTAQAAKRVIDIHKKSSTPSPDESPGSASPSAAP